MENKVSTESGRRHDKLSCLREYCDQLARNLTRRQLLPFAAYVNTSRSGRSFSTARHDAHFLCTETRYVSRVKIRGNLRVNRKNEYFSRRVLRREYLIFPRGRETRTGTIGLFVLRIDGSAPAIDILEEDRARQVDPGWWNSLGLCRVTRRKNCELFYTLYTHSLFRNITFMFIPESRAALHTRARARAPTENTRTGLRRTRKRSKGR